MQSNVHVVKVGVSKRVEGMQTPCRKTSDQDVTPGPPFCKARVLSTLTLSIKIVLYIFFRIFMCKHWGKVICTIVRIPQPYIHK